MGGQTEVVKLICSKRYLDGTNHSMKDLTDKLLKNKDIHGNNCFHSSYARHYPKIRRELRKYAGKDLTAQLHDSRNWGG